VPWHLFSIRPRLRRQLQPIEPQLLKVPGVKHVVVEQVWDPAWSSNRLTDEGRRKLGLEG
jgi:metal-sulfur cluster biosynthetic enzyme